MLRRKILTSAMASVMALTSISAVAFADETATDVKNVKTKADLEAYVKSFNSFRDRELDNYGSVSGERFLSALEYAENVLESTTSTVDDYTVAYAMIEAVYNKLAIHTASELRDLLNKCKQAYESDNIYNEELGDAIYVDENSGNNDIKSYGYIYFKDAYEEADSVLGSADSRIITDAYETLEDQYNNLKACPVVTKAQFRSALKAYEKMLQDEFKYESWRVGSLGNDWINFESVNDEAGWWGYSGQKYAYGTLYAHLASAYDEILNQYNTMDNIKSLSKTSDADIVKGYFAAKNAVLVMNDWKPDDNNRASKANVKKLLDEYHGRLVYDYNTTAAENLFSAVTTAAGLDKLTVEIVKNDAGATEFVKAEDLGNKSVWNTSSGSVLVDADNDGHGILADKLISAEINVKSTNAAIWIPINENGYWNGDTVVSADPKNSKNFKKINKNVVTDLTQFIPIASTMLSAGTANSSLNSVLDGDDTHSGSCAVDHDHPNGDGAWVDDRDGKWGSVQGTSQITAPSYTTSQDKVVPTVSELDKALALAEVYLGGDKDAIKASDIYYIDTTDSIAAGTAKASSAEWALVYRYLKYALADKYDAETGTNTKAEVSELIDKAYDLADLTGDAALFAFYHEQLVDARKEALEWIKVANKDKKYKDNVSTPNGRTATAMYGALKGKYDELEAIYKKYQYSFGDIYNKISDVKAMIDDGKIEATADLLAALENTAYQLSIVGSYDEEYGIENDAFTSDRIFQDFNRVNTESAKFTLRISDSDSVTIFDADSSNVSKQHKALTDAYKALLAIVEPDETAKLGDVNKDGAINAIDAALILKAAADGTVDTLDKAVADFNTDGAINALDAAAILKGVAAGTLK